MSDIDNVIAKLKETTKIKYAKIKVEKGETSPFESNFGGTPYYPKGFEYPFVKSLTNPNIQVPMTLLAQINFEEVPRLENFPEKGILQIFISPDDDLCGANFDKPTEQENYKIFYHADIDKNPENQQKAPKIRDYISDYDDYCFPVSVPLKLSFEPAEGYVSTSNYRFDELFLKLYNEETGSDYEDTLDLPDEIFSKLIDELSDEGHRMGGYPFFTQSDPREYNEEYKDYNTLLLQIDSETGDDGEDWILWGDCGVANFFIKPEDLKNCKFDDVLYNWDCC